MLALFSVLLLAALGAGLYAVDSIRGQFGAEFARAHALLQKQKLSTVLSREVAVAQRFSELAAMRAWLQNEDDPQRFAAMLADAENFRRVFPDQSYYVMVDRSLHYYAHDGKRDPAQPSYTLKAGEAADAWYFATREAAANASAKDYSLNVNIDEKLKVAKVWINVPVRVDGMFIGLISSGIDLSLSDIAVG